MEEEKKQGGNGSGLDEDFDDDNGDIVNKLFIKSMEELDRAKVAQLKRQMDALGLMKKGNKTELKEKIGVYVSASLVHHEPDYYGQRFHVSMEALKSLMSVFMKIKDALSHCVQMQSLSDDLKFLRNNKPQDISGSKLDHILFNTNACSTGT